MNFLKPSVFVCRVVSAPCPTMGLFIRLRDLISIFPIGQPANKSGAGPRKRGPTSKRSAEDFPQQELARQEAHYHVVAATGGRDDRHVRLALATRDSRRV